MTTYNSAELATLAERIPKQAAAQGLLYVGEAEFKKAVDVELNGATVSLDTALAIASAGQAPFVSLTTLIFQSSELKDMLTEDDDEDVELPDKVLRLISASSSHNGDVEALVLLWPAHGLMYKWTATSDWRDKLVEKISASLGEALVEAGEESSEWQKIHNAQLREFEAKVNASKEFRAASVQNRRAIAESIALTISDELVDSWGFRQALTEAGRLAKRNAFEYEQIFSSQIQDLVVELRSQPEWRTAMTDKKMKETTLKFLTEKADGYRPGTAFVEEVLQATLGPSH